MANSGAALGALSFIVLIIGAILFFVAKAKRPLAKKMLIGGAITFVVAIIITPEPVQVSTPQQAIATSIRAVTPANVKAVGPMAPALVSATSKAETQQRETALSYIRTTDMHVVFCSVEVDNTQMLIEKVSVGTASTMQAYSAANVGERDCKKVSSELKDVNSAPFADVSWNEIYSRTIPSCRSAIRDGQRAMMIAKSVLDGNASLAKAQEYKDAKNGMASKSYECRSGLYFLAQKSGIPKAEVNFLHIS